MTCISCWESPQSCTKFALLCPLVLNLFGNKKVQADLINIQYLISNFIIQPILLILIILQPLLYCYQACLGASYLVPEMS